MRCCQAGHNNARICRCIVTAAGLIFTLHIPWAMLALQGPGADWVWASTPESAECRVCVKMTPGPGQRLAPGAPSESEPGNATHVTCDGDYPGLRNVTSSLSLRVVTGDLVLTGIMPGDTGHGLVMVPLLWLGDEENGNGMNMTMTMSLSWLYLYHPSCPLTVTYQTKHNQNHIVFNVYMVL